MSNTAWADACSVNEVKEGKQMQAIRRLAVPALLGLISGVLAASASHAQQCTPKHRFPTVTPGYLTVAPGTYPPYSFVDPHGQLQGIDGDIVKAIATMECLKVKAIPVDPAAALQYVIGGRAELTTGDWYRTEARARVTYLSAPLYLDQMAVYSRTGIDSVPQFMNDNVGSTQGNLWIPDVKKLLGDRLKIYPVSVAALQDLEAGRINVVLDGYSVGVLAHKQGAMKDITIKVIKPDPRVGASMEAGQGTFPEYKGNPALNAALDSDIAELHSDGMIAKVLVTYGLDPSAADTGPPRLIK
jgi:polar amino acid transport system substrate-binding protein